MVSEIFLKFSHYKFMETLDSQGEATLGPGSWLAGFM